MHQVLEFLRWRTLILSALAFNVTSIVFGAGIVFGRVANFIPETFQNCGGG
jgi:hypothetical protein